MNSRPEIPESAQSERCALSCAMLYPEFAVPILLQCSPDDFNDLRHRAIFEAIRDLIAEHRTPDYIAISELLENRGQTLVDPTYLANTYTFTPTGLRAQEFVSTVMDRGARRRILDGLSVVAQQCYDIEAGVDAIVDNGTAMLQGQVANIASQGTEALAGARSVLAKTHFYYSNPIEPWETRGVDTGYRHLNIALDGWKRGNVYYLLGLEHSGKTWLALNLAMNLCARGGTVVFFSLEQSTSADEDPQKVTLWERVILAQAGVLMSTYLKGRLTEDDYNRILHAGDDVSGWNLTMYDDRRTLPQMEAVIRSIARERRVDLAVIDYLKLIQQAESYANRNQEIGGLTSKLKRFALDVDVPLLVPQQVGSKGIAARQNKRIALSDGYESGHISQDADIVLGLNRDELFNPQTEKPNIIELDVLKDRVSGGTGGSVDLYFNKRTGRILTTHRVDAPLPEEVLNDQE